MNPKQIFISVIPDYDADQEELAELTKYLWDDILEIEVEDVQRAKGGELPEGAKSMGAFDWNTLIITLIGTGGLVTTFLTVLGGYLNRNQGTKLHLTLPNGAEITLESNLANREDINRMIELIERSLNEEKGRSHSEEDKLVKSTKSLVSLREKMISFLSLEEIATIYFDMGIEYHSLPGETKNEKVIELLGYCRRRNQVALLRERCKLQNDKVDWGE